MKELKRLDKYTFINVWGTTYTKAVHGWILCNSLDCDDPIQVSIQNPTFEERVEDLLEIAK